MYDWTAEVQLAISAANMISWKKEINPGVISFFQLMQFSSPRNSVITVSFIPFFHQTVCLPTKITKPL